MLLERFLRYVAVDTTANPAVEAKPTSPGQWELLRMLEGELKEMGAAEVELHEEGYLTATIPASTGAAEGGEDGGEGPEPVIGFLAHVDTSPDAPGANIKPQIHEQGGETIITSDGTTLLGADDKAGVAEIMTAAQILLGPEAPPHGKIRLAFTTDEEIGRGTEGFDVERFGADWAYTLDGGPLGELEWENFNAAEARVEIEGRSAHPGDAKGKMVNATRVAVEIDGALPAGERPETTSGREGFYHLMRVEGTVERASMQYIIRDHDREKFEARKRVLAEEVAKHQGARVTITDQYYNMREVLERHPHVVERARRAMQAAGVEPVEKPIRGGTDGARLSWEGLPCPNLFAGGENFHSLKELTNLNTMKKAVETILGIARRGALLVAAIAVATPLMAAKPKQTQTDREYWAEQAYKLSKPILEPMSRGELRETMPMGYSPTWDGRDPEVAWMEAFGRLMAGIAPWIALPDDGTPEGAMRAELRGYALKSYANAVDPESPDYLGWRTTSAQVLVDAAYVANSLMRAPEALWEPLDEVTKARYVAEFRQLMRIPAWYNNWILFRAMIDAFLLMVGEEHDAHSLYLSVAKVGEWYVGDGWYSDGPEFSLDYYNSYVIHPMMVETTEVMTAKKARLPLTHDLALRRMQRYNVLLERLISPEGAYPPMGRSITYRMGVFQSLALSAWKYGLPERLTNGGVRSALTAVMHRLFDSGAVYNSAGYLVFGFAGEQPDIADYYTNTGSLYMTSLVFLPLGLPASAPFWTDPAEAWTAKRAWAGEPFQKDYHESVMK